jgi:hypothetical protein
MTAAVGAPAGATFRTHILAAGKTATGIAIPTHVVQRLGRGKRPPVRVTIGAHTYRSTVAVMGGQFMIGLSADNRRAAAVGAGDEVEVTLEVDTHSRDVTVPADLAAALDDVPDARSAFQSLSYSRKQRYVLAVEAAKTSQTRQRRIIRTLEDLTSLAGHAPVRGAGGLPIR